MALEITQTEDPAFPYRVTRICRTWPEAQAAIDAMGPIHAEAYIGNSSDTLIHADAAQMRQDALDRMIAWDNARYVHIPAPALTPEQEVLVDRACADDPNVGSLKAGEAE